MVCAMDLMLVPPLVPLFGSGMIARGTKVSALSSIMNSLASRSSLAGSGIPLRAKVVFELVRETRARPAMVDLATKRGGVEKS